MSLENYKNSTFVKVLFCYRDYIFDFTKLKAVESINLTESVETSTDGGGTGLSDTQGSVVIADYYEDLFTLLTLMASNCVNANMQALANNANRDGVSKGNPSFALQGSGGDTNYGSMVIGVKCYSGTRVWFLNVKGWTYTLGSPSKISFSLDLNSGANVSPEKQKFLTELNMMDFGAVLDNSAAAYDNHRKSIQDAVSKLQTLNTDTSSSAVSDMPKDDSVNMTRGLVGKRYSDPVEVLKDIEKLYNITIKFATTSKGFDGTKGFEGMFTLDEWISELKKDKKALYFRNNVYELQAFTGSGSNNSSVAIVEREFTSCLNQMFEARAGLKTVNDLTSLSEAERTLYEPSIKNDNDGSYYVALRKDAEDERPADLEGTNLSLDRVVFMYNAPKPQGLWNNKVVIPLDSLSVTLDNQFIAMNKLDVMDTPNGTMVFTPSGRFMSNDNATGTYMRMAAIAMGNSTRTYNITMSCRNYIHWGASINQYAEIYSFTNNGLAGTVQGFYLVQTVQYSWSGGVISTNVTLQKNPEKVTQQAINSGGSNRAKVHEDSPLHNQQKIMQGLINSLGGQTSSGDSSGSSNTEESDGVSSEDRGQPDNDGGSMAMSGNLCSYLSTNHVNPIPISVDRTAENIKNGKFATAVNELLKTLNENTRVIDVGSEWFKKHILEEGNMAIIGLLGGAGNWGYKNVPSSVQDCLTLMNDGRKRTAFGPPDSAHGKGFWDYKVGGLGIAHFDSSNLYKIYRLVGFSKAQATQEMLELIFWKEADKARWEDMGNGRMKPYHPAGAKCICNFDGMPSVSDTHLRTGLAARFISSKFSSKPWQDWAREILYYRDAEGNYPYQVKLVELWAKDFWGERRAKLSKGTLNDMFCIARIANSTTKYADKCCKADGTAVCPKDQYQTYCVTYANTRAKDEKKKEEKRARYTRQLGHGRRAADILGYFYAQGMIKS